MRSHTSVYTGIDREKRFRFALAYGRPLRIAFLCNGRPDIDTESLLPIFGNTLDAHSRCLMFGLLLCRRNCSFLPTID